MRMRRDQSRGEVRSQVHLSSSGRRQGALTLYGFTVTAALSSFDNAGERPSIFKGKSEAWCCGLHFGSGHASVYDHIKNKMLIVVSLCWSAPLAIYY